MRAPRLSATGSVPLHQRLVAGVALAAASPILALAALAVRRTSPGPALFTQERVGLEGRPITIIKLRTMHADASSASTATTANDQRITATGRWLRRYKLDELPQLWSVIKGDMALVGPRPDVAEVIDSLPPAARQQLLRQQPGITGIASLYFRDEATLLDAVEDPDRFSAGPLIQAKAILNDGYATRASWRDDLRVVALTARHRSDAVDQLAARLAPGYLDTAPFQAVLAPVRRDQPAGDRPVPSAQNKSLRQKKTQ